MLCCLVVRCLFVVLLHTTNGYSVLRVEPSTSVYRSQSDFSFIHSGPGVVSLFSNTCVWFGSLCSCMCALEQYTSASESKSEPESHVSMDETQQHTMRRICVWVREAVCLFIVHGAHTNYSVWFRFHGQSSLEFGCAFDLCTVDGAHGSKVNASRRLLCFPIRIRFSEELDLG